tara:strand:- start:719 stop:1150 length:432 start_codon:yes stop_codon:yes gene_type:complete
LSWQYILKDSKQVSRNVGGLNWDDEEIPEEEDDDCSRELKQLYEKAKNHPNASNVEWIGGDFPKSVVCGILKELKEVKYGKDEIFRSYLSQVKTIGEGEDKVAVYATFSPRGFFFTANQITDKKQVELDIVLAGGYGEENDFR